MDELIATYDAMLKELETDADASFLPSAFWRELNRKNLYMISNEGFNNFKRTISQNYYNWMITDLRHPFFRHAFTKWCRTPNLLPLTTSLTDIDHLSLTTIDDPIRLSPAKLSIYRLYVCFVWTIMLQEDQHGLHFHVNEPNVGNPIGVQNHGNLISQDLANSIIECNVLANLGNHQENFRVAELGAGYGRLAHVFASTQAGKYFIFDIPPALCVAQHYLEQTLGAEHVFRFRHFDKVEDVEDQIQRASVVLLTANQMRKFPNGYFDAFVSISTLPEMRSDQVELYLSEMQRLTQRYIFLKQWRHWTNPVDGTKTSAESYRFGQRWTLVWDRTDPVIPTFFNRLWAHD